MTGIEIVYLVAALAAAGIFLVWVRRAARKQLGDGDRGRPRLREPDEAEADEARPSGKPGKPGRKGPEERTRDIRRGTRPGRRPTAEPAAKEPGRQKPAKPAEAEPPESDEAELAEEAADDEAAATLRAGLAKTRGGFVAKLARVFGKKQIDRDLLPELEEVLLTADIGPRTAAKIFETIKGSLSRDQLTDPEAIWNEIRRHSRQILAIDAPPIDFARAHPLVILILGVNGVGKTTTIGKLAAKLARDGKKVLLGAGDTFRAAATEQLEIWGQRAGAPVVRGKEGADPSSVLFETIKRGVDEGFDVVIGDTAGRLHTKVDLMEELKKVRRVAAKAMPGAPHETWLVLDSTTGQNAIAQAQIFKEAMEITGIILTKLDGTSKGGVILGISDELKLPVRYIGIGERVEDLREFDAEAFVTALYEPAQPEAA